MAAIADSRGTYSWWWDGHITPKNSKWLQENLSDMDDKVLEMLKLIEEDGDSFARRAEMFYQRRPKLLELIEQFHRAYRALAERYDHASGVLRQAHNTMTEAALDTNEFDVGKFLSTRISDLQESVSRAGIDIETLKQDLGRVEAERDAAVEECSEVERLRVALSETVEEKEAFALQCREGSLNISELDQRLNSELEKCGLLEKSNRALQSELHDSVRKMGDQSEELIEEIKDLSRVWTVLQQQAHENSNRVIEEVEARNRDLEEKFSSASAISSKLKDENIRLRDIAKDLEADIERQVKHQNDLHREIDRLKNQIGAVKSEANEEKASLASRLEIASYKNEKLEKKCRELENSLSSADSELEVSRNRAEASWLLLLFEQLVLIAERERSERRYRELETKCFGFDNENTKLRLDLDKERKQHKDLYEALGLEIVTLKDSVGDLEDRNSSVEGDLEKIVETLRSSESRVRDMELEILERDTEMKSLSDQLNVMLTEARDFSRMAERGLESGIESSVLYTVLRQMDVEVKRIAAEREKHVSDLVKRILTANIRETLLEESKDREIEELKGRIESLEGQNVRLAPLLATYHTAAETSARVDNLEIKDIKHVTNVRIGSPKPVKLEAPRNTVRDQEDEHKETRPLLLKEAKRHAFKQPMKLTRRRQLSQGESDVVVTKDVVLDQMSECSGTDDRILELWEAADDVSGSSINLKVGMRSRSQSRVASSHRNSRESMSVTEKELGVDGEVEILSEKKVPEPSGRRSVRRVLERLNADVQKLTNLHITMEDLRRKVELTDQRAEEYDNVKEQLEETEVAIMNFFDTNQKLTKSMQKLVSTNEGGDSVRKVSEQARRVTEEIGRLQVELQRIQWLLVKLDEEDKKEKRRGSGGGARPTTTIGNSSAERKTKVVLKDILHVRMKKNMKRKKGQFCGCVHLPSSRSE